jgi:predicted transglutaminase-like cysteine proteinase
MIEDKPVASTCQGFAQIRQVLIAFPHVEIGAKLYVKYLTKKTKTEVPNHFNTEYSYGRYDYLSKSHIKISSALPLHMVVNDPENVLKITKDSENNCRVLTIDLAKPIYRAVAEHKGFIDRKQYTWVSISTATSWSALAKKLAPKFVQTMNQNLPDIFTAIVNLTKQEQEEVIQINRVTSLLREKIRYMSDLRTLEGHYFPRDLATIADSQFGDCKDFSVATAAMLKNLGYKVQGACVMSSDSMPIVDALPTLKNFNHCIIKVTGKQGKIYWIDPTHDVSMAQGIFSNIAGKMALVLDDKQPNCYETIPTIDPKNSKEIRIQKLTIQDNNVVNNTGTLNCIGEKARRWTEYRLSNSDQEIKNILFDYLGDKNILEKNKHELQLPSNLDSRIVSDLTFSYNFDDDHQLAKTNFGPVIRLSSPQCWNFYRVPEDNVSSMCIGDPQTYQYERIISNMHIKNINRLNYKVDKPWCSLQRMCAYQGKDTVINDTVVIKQSIIPSKDVHTASFKAFRDDLRQNFLNAAIVLESVS